VEVKAMNEPAPLDQSARDLVADGREGVAPNEFVAERLRRSVARTLSGTAPPARSRSRSAPILVALGAAVLGGALYANELVRREERVAPAPNIAPTAVQTASKPASAPLVPVIPGPETSDPVAPNDPSVRTPSSVRAMQPKTSRSQQLGAEIELLARVNAAVNAGDGGRALELLAEYDRKFRPSILAEERAAASILALCAAGRTGEARAAAEQFRRRSPRSPLLGRIAGSCARTE
jgi:hypothetical protein